MDYAQKIVTEIEVLSPEGIKTCFENGVHPNDLYKGKPLFDEMTSGYARGPKFRECVKVFVDFGLHAQDEMLLAVLLDDHESLEKLLASTTAIPNKRYTLQNAFTPIYEASLLHICAEFNHLACAKILVAFGADINCIAGIDEHGFGGQTPIFHTVNQHANFNMEMMEFLLHQGADIKQTVKGLIWGKGYAWETYIPVVNPISYAMMGLLPQFHRKETDVYEVISMLMKEAFQMDYQPRNIPNKYLQK